MIEQQTSLHSGKKLSYGGANDPLLPRLIQAINHASEIEISVSFIQPSGLDLLFDPLLDALQSGASLKLLTSDYLCISHPVALRRLMLLAERGAQCKIFVCGQQSFHMKSYIFIRSEQEEIIEGCAWIGSNNISKTALLHSHEWALRHDFEPPLTSPAALEFAHIRKQFDAIFNHNQSQSLTHAWIDSYLSRYQHTKQQRGIAAVSLYEEQEHIEPPTPNTVQMEALAALKASREQGFTRGLVVLATGMGKTWLAAFDALQTEAKKVLFVAHREEILIQAEKTFNQLVPEAKTGSYNGLNQDEKADYLFASVATLGKQQHLQRFAADHFDYIVVDEFHHAAAKSYRQLLAYFRPQFLLGLTATPERSDQADILSLCDNNLVFERNLVHGIDGKLLVPFDYHGIYDQAVNYQDIPWRNGKFDPDALDNALATQRRAAHVLHHWQHSKQSRTLAFCVSKKHADFMAKYFTSKGINAIAVYSDSKVRRNEALKRLEQGRIEVIFSVDLFNEGTDLPAIDTILMIRPTESKILFLQQLGRGLRLSHQTQKQKLVVLDFIGNHESFLNRPTTLYNLGSLREVLKNLNQVNALPKGCHVNFDLELIEFWQNLVKQLRFSVQEEYQQLANQLAHRPTASEFYHHGVEMNKVRQQAQSWFHLVASQEAEPRFTDMVAHYGDFLLHGVETTTMTKSFKAILLEALLELDGLRNPPTLAALAERSHAVFCRRPDLMAQELTQAAKQFKAQDKGWLTYWKDNPIKAFTKANSKTPPWFQIGAKQRFVATFVIDEADIELLHDWVQELVDLRLAQYVQRPQQKATANKSNASTNNTRNTNTTAKPLAQVLPFESTPTTEGTLLPFYPELKIACGHFKHGSAQNAEQYCVPEGHGLLDPKRHFVAPASGNSMNGGKNPIQDGDLLLLEWVTPESAGSISNLTMAIETQDDTGDNQYLLRVVRKTAPNQYELHAQNPAYQTMLATDSMKTFARLKTVLESQD
ncbi:DEAD/DEAH box helicase family protein [Shewanella xiamenensis]|uniref:DEAD/DEAH box helicase family protein n=1 Tax=Shewanella xiamenensis TaxID=332186 RepID=UPI001C4FF5A5|nr:DEAD/DEAH box helicase family protein [Shewanella xiamenensis]MBW0280658.1 DEAD/DEAH box helicase [Shewanella xiamenensis]MCT8870191.1 DEAD/DEAH box helicase family protein [Shewanella xiamenensis]UWH40985.1 DEAD/DEAH box helicase family protein [Shewanella xiamenensis]